MTIWLAKFSTQGDGPRLAVKDAIDVEGSPTTAACPVVGDHAVPAERDAPVVAAARAQGARVVGKTNLTELCRAADGVNPWTGTPANPLDADRMPGGSSSGSAVAVALGEADVALGTDTGGSGTDPGGVLRDRGPEDRRTGGCPLEGSSRSRRRWTRSGRSAVTSPRVALGMRLIEPGFAPEPCEPGALIGRLRPAGTEVDAASSTRPSTTR